MVYYLVDTKMDDGEGESALLVGFKLTSSRLRIVMLGLIWNNLICPAVYLKFGNLDNLWFDPN